MSHTISIEQASVELRGLVRALRQGDEIVLTDNDKPVARIIADAASLPGPATIEHVAGAWKGKFEILDDSDDVTIEHFREYLP
jgi:antitoxin (DNA-binding transcriptional repressor) of toxin-antitoxin stability system